MNPRFVIFPFALAMALWPEVHAGELDAAQQREQINKWLEELGDPSHSVRKTAVHKLYEAGPSALSALQHATEGDDFEAAMRARSLIERIQKLFLVGARIDLSVDRRQFKWDEPVSLRVKIVNPSDFPIHLPFLIKDRQSIDADALAVQVGNLLDAADFLVVTGPDSRPLEPTVDDYRGHPGLERAVDVRAYLEPASLLQAGGEFILTLEALNRGFARFRMPEQGEYRVQFAYVPEWDDPKMREDGVGRVASAELRLTVTQAAPAVIRTSNRPISISLQEVDADVVVRATNTHDRPMGLNLNLGGKGLADHAHVEWVWDAPEGRVAAEQPVAGVQAFQTEKLVTLKPAESVELCRIRREHVRRLPGFESVPRTGSIKLAVRYTNLLDKAVILRRLTEEKPEKGRLQRLYEAIPLPTFTGSATSETIELRAGTTETVMPPP